MTPSDSSPRPRLDRRTAIKWMLTAAASIAIMDRATTAGAATAKIASTGCDRRVVDDQFVGAQPHLHIIRPGFDQWIEAGIDDRIKRDIAARQRRAGQGRVRRSPAGAGTKQQKQGNHHNDDDDRRHRLSRRSRPDACRGQSPPPPPSPPASPSLLLSTTAPSLARCSSRLTSKRKHAFAAGLNTGRISHRAQDSCARFFLP